MMEGDGDDMFSNAGDAAEKNQTGTLTLDQDQEGDRKEEEEEEAEVGADSDAGCTIDRLRDEIQGLRFKKRDLELQLVIPEATSRSLAGKVKYLEEELVRAQQGLAEGDHLKLALKDLKARQALFSAAKAALEAQDHALLRQLLAAAEEKEKEMRGLHEMVKKMGTKVRDLTKKLRLTGEQAERAVEERINKAVEEARTRPEGELAQLRSDVGERDGALAAMRAAAAVLSAGALAACLGRGGLFSELQEEVNRRCEGYEFLTAI